MTMAILLSLFHVLTAGVLPFAAAFSSVTFTPSPHTAVATPGSRTQPLDATLSRRRVVGSTLATSAASLLGGVTATAPTTTNTIAHAIDTAASTALPNGLLDSRVRENVLSPPPYGLECADVVYPSWFRGTWAVRSETVSVEAPCGVALFGGNATYAKALREVGTTLRYDSRFVSPSSSLNTAKNNDNKAAPAGCLADREYNVKSIAKVAIGINSVVDIPLATPNKLTAILAMPNNNNNDALLQVDLFTVNRRQETMDDTHFDCSEVVREIVSAANSGNTANGSSSTAAANPSTLLKEIETTSLYTYNPVTNSVTCQQRSASFVLPSQTNPIQLQLWQMARGRPVDVRMYNVEYTKKDVKL